ncbi:MAG TPA: UPF0179 family protein [Thermoplasmata archaeon]|nr:UPF0179 family protein [Thermoplasmata archaeon]
MAEITLLSKEQANAGFEFVYQGGAPVCRTCPYRHACLTLDAGRRYRVVRVRPVEHPCALQEVAANVVEVEPIARSLVVEARGAIPGSSVDVGRFACSRLDCPNWDICAGPSLPSKQRYRVERAAPSLAECRIGRTLKQVEAV